MAHTNRKRKSYSERRKRGGRGRGRAKDTVENLFGYGDSKAKTYRVKRRGGYRK